MSAANDDQPQTAAAEEEYVETAQDKALKAELAKLEDEMHDIDVEYHGVVEETATRDDAEARLDKLKEERAAAEKERDDEQAITDPLEARVAVVGDNIDLYPRIRALEEDFNKQPDFSQFWAEVADETNLEELVEAQPEDGSPSDEVKQRIDATQSAFNSNVAKLKAILEEQDAIVKAFDEQVQAAVGNLKTELQVELRRLKARRAKLQVIAKEQHYHYRRGTHVKARTIDKKMKDQFLDVEHAKDEHNKLSEMIHDHDGELEFNKKELEGMRKDHRHFLERSAHEKAALTTNIEALKQEVEEVDWELRALTEENEQLRELRRQLIKVHAETRQQLTQ